MKTRFSSCILLSSILAIGIYNSSINFVSAEVTYECFGSGTDHYFCVMNSSATGEMWVTECIKDKDGKVDCHALGPKAKPPGIEQIIRDTIKEEKQSNSNDLNDIGGIKGLTNSNETGNTTSGTVKNQPSGSSGSKTGSHAEQIIGQSQ